MQLSQNRIISIFFFLIISASIHGGTVDTTTYNKKKFIELNAKYAKYALTNDSVFYVLDEMEHESLKKPDHRTLYHLLLVWHAQDLLNLCPTKLIAYTDNLLPEFAKHTDLPNQAKIQSIRVDYYISKYMYQKALYEISDFDKTYNTPQSEASVKIAIDKMFGLVYMGMNRFGVAAHYYAEACDMLNKQGSDIDEKSEVYVNAIQSCYFNGSYKKALTLCDQIETELLDKVKTTPSYAQRHPLVDEQCLRLLIYLKQADSSNVIRIATSLARINPASLILDQQFWYFYSMGIFNQQKGNDEMALHYLNHLQMEKRLPIEYKTFLLEEKLKIYKKRGNYELACDVQKQIIAINDSTGTLKVSAELDELNSMHHLDMLKKKEERRMNLIYILAVFCLFLIAFLLVFVYYWRRVRHKNKVLFLRLTEEDKLKRRLEIYEKTDVELSGGADIDETQRLFLQLEHLMHVDKVYLDPNLTRGSLAEKLNTNRTYLGNVVSEKTEYSSIIDYINNYRLEYARSLLINKTQLNIKEVYHSAGFVSKATFYRLFVKRFELTPSELRNLAMKEGEA